MKLKFFPVLLLTAVACSCSNVSSALSISHKTVKSSSDSPIVTRTIDVDKVSSLECNRAVNIVYQQGTSTSVTLSAPADIAEYIQIESHGSKLSCTVNRDYEIHSGMDRVVVNVVSPMITYFDATTAGSIKINNPVDFGDNDIDIDATTAANVTIESIKCGELESDVSTAASINIKNVICGGRVKADASTAGSVNIGGSANKVSFEASTGAGINASKLVAEYGKASASTGGNVKCNVEYIDKSESTGGGVHNNR